MLNCFPIAGHDTTGFVNHTPTILYPGTNLYLQKFWVQDCWRMAHKTSCIMPVPVMGEWGVPVMGEMAGKTARAKCRQHTSHVTTALIAQALVFGSREHRFEL